MRKCLVMISLIVLLVGCSNALQSAPTLTKTFIGEHAEIGIGKTEVEAIFGRQYFSGEGKYGTMG